MLLQPKRTKFRRVHRGRRKGEAHRGIDGRVRGIRISRHRQCVGVEQPDRGGAPRRHPIYPPWWQVLDSRLPG